MTAILQTPIWTELSNFILENIINILTLLEKLKNRFGRMQRVCVGTAYMALSKYKASYLLTKTDGFLNKIYAILDLKYGLFITHTHAHTQNTHTHIH